MTMAKTSKYHKNHYVYATNLSNIQASNGCLSIQIRKHNVALFYHNSKVHAVDNRCPHMGFPLSKGTVKDSTLVIGIMHALILTMEEHLISGLVMSIPFL
jgi:nitrite reductase/ring-hydroxylating ferredoxin subunit